jgi:hypothetical protein
MKTELIKPGNVTATLDPTTQEALALNHMAVEFMKALETNPAQAKKLFNEVILRHMMRAMRTIKVMDDQLGDEILAKKKLLKANLALIDSIKMHNNKWNLPPKFRVEMPNFSVIEAQAIQEHEAEFNKERSLT